MLFPERVFCDILLWAWKKFQQIFEEIYLKIWIPKWLPLYLQETVNTMTVISVRDFRENQGKYLGLAASGESVILTSRRGQFKIVPVTEDDSVISKSEFFAKLEKARKSIEDGCGTKVSSEKELSSFLELL